jgi:hypothetical protein
MNNKKTANEIAVELQLKYDYFISGAIFASLGFAIQTNLVGGKYTFTLYALSLLFLSTAAIFCLYRLQQKPHIYQLHSIDESLFLEESAVHKLEIKKAINSYEKKYEISYYLMLLSLFLGALFIALAKLSTIYLQVF